RDLQIGFEKEGEIGQRREAVNAADPFGGAATNYISRESSKDVAIAEHDVAGAKQRDKVAFVAVGEVRGMNETESGGGQQFPFLALAGGGFDQLGRIPFAEVDLQALQLQPA